MFKIGDMVTSKAGHDEGRIYVVVGQIGDDFVLLADSKYRMLDNPKAKRIKHIKKVGESARLCELLDNGKLCDADIVHELKICLQKYSKNHNKGAIDEIF